MPQGNAKGLLFVYLKDYVTERQGATAWEALVKDQKPVDVTRLRELILASGWYSIGTWNRLLAEYLTRHHDANPMAAMRQFGDYLGERELNSLVRFVLKLGSPEFMLRRTDFLWRRYFDTGTFGADEVSTQRWKLWLEAPRDEETAAGRFTCGNGPGPWLERGLLLSGLRKGKVTKTACRWDGARRCEFTASW